MFSQVVGWKGKLQSANAKVFLVLARKCAKDAFVLAAAPAATFVVPTQPGVILGRSASNPCVSRTVIIAVLATRVLFALLDLVFLSARQSTIPIGVALTATELLAYFSGRREGAKLALLLR